MITPQTSRIWRNKKSIDEHGEGHPPMIYRLTKADFLVRLIPKAMPEAGESKEHPKEGAKTDKGKEIPVVAPPDAIIQPDTMMILSFDTIVANSAMMATRRPPYIAGLAVLGRDVHG